MPTHRKQHKVVIILTVNLQDGYRVLLPEIIWWHHNGGKDTMHQLIYVNGNNFWHGFICKVSPKIPEKMVFYQLQTMLKQNRSLRWQQANSSWFCPLPGMP